MFKILVWDYTGISAQWIDQFADKKFIDIVGTMTPQQPASEILLKRDAWDWLLIFEQSARNFFDATIQLLKLPLDKVIYALDINSWLQHPKAAFSLINPDSGGWRLRLSELCFKQTAESIRHVYRRGAFVHRHIKR